LEIYLHEEVGGEKRMTLEQDWDRLTVAYKKFRDAHWNPKLVVFIHIQDLRKADNKGIDFVVRRLRASKEYNQRIRLYGAPSSSYSQCTPLRCYDPMFHRERLWIYVGIPELRI